MAENGLKKIFGIGFQKTGTTTLDYALRHFNLRPVGYSPELIEDIQKKDFINVIEKVNSADVFQDNPWPIIFKELDELFPGSKFILTERDVESWYKSMVKHFGKEETTMRKWIYGSGSPVDNETQYKKVYNSHYSEVKSYFSKRPEDFIVLNWEAGHGWKELCEFLSLEIPNIPFPHVNKNSHRNFFVKAWMRLISHLN